MSIHDTLHRPVDVTVAPRDEEGAERARRPARHVHVRANRAGTTAIEPPRATSSRPAGSFQGVRLAEGEHQPGFFGFLAAQ